MISNIINIYQLNNAKWNKIKYICICFAGPRDHPDIAEAFMHLHAQVGQTDCDVMWCARGNDRNVTQSSLFFNRFLKGSLTCTCLTSWMLKRCSTVVSNWCFSLKELLVLQLAFWKGSQDLHWYMWGSFFFKINSSYSVFFPGILSLKFPETPTVKAASLFFVSWSWKI